MSNNYRDKLINERDWLRYEKAKLIQRLVNKSPAGFIQVLKRFDKINFEIERISKTLKDNQ